MDPDATLLHAMQALVVATPEDIAEAADAFESLAEWLRKGGFAPSVPVPVIAGLMRVQR